MGGFRSILISALFAGIIAGTALTGLQTMKVYPLIFAAEKFENERHDHAAKAPASHHPAVSDQGNKAAAWMPADGPERILYSLLSNILIGVGLGLVLAAIFALRPVANWRQGVVWGLGGFISVNLAPALGLPPELPGMPAGVLLARQTWWLSTALFTAGGIALIFLSRALIWRLPGVLLIALPHIYGAPHLTGLGSDVPATLAAGFATASLASNLIFWAVLGLLTAETMARLDRTEHLKIA